MKLEQALNAFDFGGEIINTAPYGGGHINDTFAVTVKLNDNSEKRYILQSLNTNVFKKPYEVMDNIAGITKYLKEIIIKEGGDPDRETLFMLHSKEDKICFTDDDACVWRVTPFVEDTICIEQVENIADLENSAKSFGKFLKRLADYPAENLYETIEKFHDTRHRYDDFIAAVDEDKCDRVKNIKEHIDFVISHKEDCAYLMNLLESGKLPLRVTHNDTKINNVLLDAKTGEGICVIDLDTIMPGLAVTDYGDAVRCGATYAAEDEPDVSKVKFDLELFEAYTRGYLSQTSDVLTPMEKECLTWGAKVIALELGMRFLTDYIQGDEYFKIHREGHNLDRARNQFKLVKDMEQYWQEMNEIVKKY